MWVIRDQGGFPARPTGVRGQPSDAALVDTDTGAASDRHADAYQGFEAVALPLDERRSRWLPGLQKDGTLVGINRGGTRVTGYDIAPEHVERDVSARELTM